MKIDIASLMKESGVSFGTSGARGLSDSITDLVAYAYTVAFLQHLDLKKEFRKIAVAGDLRPSTPRIKNGVIEAAYDCGYQVIDCGFVPSPVVAFYGLKLTIPTVMVTGSHIPADRNGIKFTTPLGEISKADEKGITTQVVDIPEGLFDSSGKIQRKTKELEVDTKAVDIYIERYLKAFPKELLKGKKIGVYQHSAVGRDITLEIITKLGGEGVALGRSDSFIPVDTEAIRPEDVKLAEEWSRDESLFAIISTDGDGDRPLVADEKGKWFRGDIVGILTAQFLQADAVVTPVSCNSAVDLVGFNQVYRTKIGSPYVIAGMEQATLDGWKKVVGYEANGGFLQNSSLTTEVGELDPLPTRDPLIVHLAILSLAINKGCAISELIKNLPARFTLSDRLKEFPVVKSKAILEKLSVANESGRYPEAEECFFAISGEIKEVNFIDGMRMIFKNSEIIHLRPSGNAPEFRCYVEAETETRAEEILQAVLAIMQGWR